jgi:hypothetical protein
MLRTENREASRRLAGRMELEALQGSSGGHVCVRVGGGDRGGGGDGGQRAKSEVATVARCTSQTVET